MLFVKCYVINKHFPKKEKKIILDKIVVCCVHDSYRYVSIYVLPCSYKSMHNSFVALDFYFLHNSIIITHVQRFMIYFSYFREKLLIDCGFENN